MATHDLFLQGDLSSDQLVDILAISLNRNTEAQDSIGFFQTIFLGLTFFLMMELWYFRAQLAQLTRAQIRPALSFGKLTPL